MIVESTPVWQRPGLKQRRLCVTISSVFLSVLGGGCDGTFAGPEQAAPRRCESYRNAFPMAEIALPAELLTIPAVAKWARDRGIGVEVRTSEQVAIAIAAGIHPSRFTLDPQSLSERELRAIVALGPGRVVVDSQHQVELLMSAADRWTRCVVLRLNDRDTDKPDDVVRGILHRGQLNLVGLHGDVGGYDADFDSCETAVGEMVTEMELIRRRHGVVLTRLCLGGVLCAPTGDWTVELPVLWADIDESLDDACATLRFPRPLVVLSPGEAIVDQITD
jgi:diaminopimelate decarboxylase